MALALGDETKLVMVIGVPPRLQFRKTGFREKSFTVRCKKCGHIYSSSSYEVEMFKEVCQCYQK